MEILRNGLCTRSPNHASSNAASIADSIPGYRPDIDGLRAVSVLAVLIFHAFPEVLTGGFVGVDVFFVISGYVITKHMLREIEAGTFSFFAFYGRRIRRIFPALLPVLVCIYGFGWFEMLPEEFKQLGLDIAGGAGSIANLVLWHEAGYFDVSAALKPLLHLWSLGVEEQFYLAWPILLLATVRSRNSAFWPIVVVGIGSFALNVVVVHHDTVEAFYSPWTRAWEPMLGAFLAYRHTTDGSTSASHANIKGIVGLLALVVSFVFLTESFTFPGWWALVPTVGAYLVIDAGASQTFASRVLGWRPLVMIGLISYPLYLYHWPLLSALKISSGSVVPAAWRVVALLICFPLALVTYRYIETPIRKSRHPRLVVGILVLLMGGCGFAGYNAYQRGGLEFRMSHMVGAFADGVNFDRDKIWRRGECYLEGSDKSFSDSCVDAGSGPLVMLWGDSRSAALYPGLRSVSSARGVRLAQFSTSGCPPVFGGDPRCAQANARVIEIVKTTRPAIVLLTANWTTDRLQALSATVDALRAAGVGRIVLIGQVATWQSSLPKLYWLFWREHHEKMPARSFFELDPASRQYDRDGAAIAKQLDIEYFSAFDAMCNASGCVTRTGPGRGSIIMFDDSHLTPAGADVVANSLASRIFAQ
ncbi:acyltransferase [Burkholderia vietnamiensis]|uniref:acyltransferase family protein n=1 Tax=Burkholderia vietnamiensis TaxID=60552 RepID=UPI001B975769|nr:acyltransferase family protein [Burkholderia vietnamiensis]MBR7919731.1 acyltransferase [Burkholderia vietnamiensis]MBR8205234.1 acyltransferase [Burkholderia vietnamiensis]